MTVIYFVKLQTHTLCGSISTISGNLQVVSAREAACGYMLRLNKDDFLFPMWQHPQDGISATKGYETCSSLRIKHFSDLKLEDLGMTAMPG